MKIKVAEVWTFALFVLVSTVGGASDSDGRQTFQSILEAQRLRVVEARKKVERKFESCKFCKGVGEVVETQVCKSCRGKGKHIEKLGQEEAVLDCSKCKGKGQISKYLPCPQCRPYDLKDQNSGKDGRETVKANPCSRCSGKKYLTKEVDCRLCKGTGIVVIPPKKVFKSWSLRETEWTSERQVKCSACRGKRHKTIREKCPECKGSGIANAGTNAQHQPGGAMSASDVVKWFMYTAEQGGAKAQYCLGVMYATGDGLGKDPVEAVRWLRKSAEGRYADAQFLLGGCCAAGFGIGQDWASAATWIKSAEKLGFDKELCERTLERVERKDTSAFLVSSNTDND